MKIPKLSLKNFLTLKKVKWLLLIIVFGAIAIGSAYYLINRKASDHQNQQLIEKVDSLNRSGVTCDTVVEEIGNVSADQYDAQAQKKLLEQQMLCYADVRQLDNAIEVAKELRDIYAVEGNGEEVSRIDANIEGWEDTKELTNQGSDDAMSN